MTEQHVSEQQHPPVVDQAVDEVTEADAGPDPVAEGDPIAEPAATPAEGDVAEAETVAEEPADEAAEATDEHAEEPVAEELARVSLTRRRSTTTRWRPSAATCCSSRASGSWCTPTPAWRSG